MPQPTDNDLSQALVALAAKLTAPTHLIELHRERVGDDGKKPKGVPARYRSLTPAVFLLTAASFEQFIKQAGKLAGYVPPSRDDRESTKLTLGPDSIRKVFSSYDLETWSARARVSPGYAAKRNFSRGNVAPWALLGEQQPDQPWTQPAAELDQYLKDAKDLRDRMAHTGQAKGLKIQKDRSTFYDGSSPIRLMWVEGYLRAVQDLAIGLALRMMDKPSKRCIPRFPSHPPSGSAPLDIEPPWGQLVQ